ncbi:hypothetical protein BKA67DRAFT_569519, partial [Truncatella angustata]
MPMHQIWDNSSTRRISAPSARRVTSCLFVGILLLPTFVIHQEGILQLQMSRINFVSLAVKRRKLENNVGSPNEEEVALTRKEEVSTQPPAPQMLSRLNRARGDIELEFSHEVLLKHREHRLISQELAKCQIALEQLRRCHLIPYPAHVPMPEQVLNVTIGQEPALQADFGTQVPQWTPPFGVADGPYARHLARWLIPDPKFDGIPAPTLEPSKSLRASNSIDAHSRLNTITK